MRIAFSSWRDLANDLAGGSEVFIDRLAMKLIGMGHEVAHLCGGPVAPRRYPVIDLGGEFTQISPRPSGSLQQRTPMGSAGRHRKWAALFFAAVAKEGDPGSGPPRPHRPVGSTVPPVPRCRWSIHRGNRDARSTGGFPSSPTRALRHRPSRPLESILLGYTLSTQGSTLQSWPMCSVPKARYSSALAD